MKTRITKRYLLLLFMFSAICGITKAQNSIDFTENFGIMTYQVLGVNKNGLRSESFSGKYRIYNHVGLLLLGYHLSVQPNPNRVYIYKGKTYSISDIPEINDIKITGVKGTLYIKHNALKPTEQERKIIINIGGYLDNSGSLGGNNIEVASKTPSTFPKNTSVRFVPEELYYNASAVQTAIEKRLTEEKEKEDAKKKKKKYDKLLHEANNLFSAKNYDQALNLYYQASYIQVADTTLAEAGIAKTRKIMEENAAKEKNIAHTYKSGECKLAGTISQRYSCPLCVQQEKKEVEAKTKEDKRVKAVNLAKAEEIRKAKVAEEQQKAAARAEAARKAAEEQKIKQEQLMAEKQAKQKIQNLIRSKNGVAKDIDYSKVSISKESKDFIVYYDNAAIKSFSKEIYETVALWYLIPNALLLAKKDKNAIDGYIYNIANIFGESLLPISDFESYEADENKKIISFYKFISTPEFIKKTLNKVYVLKLVGFFTDAEKDKALSRVAEYDPQSGFSFTNFFIAKTVKIITDYNLKVIGKQEGYYIYTH